VVLVESDFPARPLDLHIFHNLDHGGEFILTGDMITAQEAFRLGLVNKVVPAGEVVKAAKDLAKKILSKGQVAVRLAMESVDEGLKVSLKDGLLIEAENVEAQLAQVVRACGLTSQRLFTRCLVCNALLEEIAKSAVADLVPPYVYRTQAQFRHCPACGRIYWRGTHWARMVERLLAI